MFAIATKTTKNILIGDALALRHDMKISDDGVTWEKNSSGEFIADPTSALEPCRKGWGNHIASFSVIVSMTIAKQGRRTITLVNCDNGETYELLAGYAYNVKVAA